MRERYGQQNYSKRGDFVDKWEDVLDEMIITEEEGYPLLEFATDRSKIIVHLNNLNSTLLLHVIKCVLYGNTTNNLDHWLDEIASYIDDANSLKFNRDKKLKQYYYEDEFFFYSGDSAEDYDKKVDAFIQRYSNRYPSALESRGASILVFEFLVALSEKFSPLLSSKNNLEKKNILNLVKEVYSSVVE